MSERFCRIPKESRVPVFEKNLSVEAYWKGNTSSRRNLLYTGYSNKNTSKATEGMVVKVIKAVNNLTVKEKGEASSSTSAILLTGGPVQGGHALGQEGRGQVPSLPAPMVATSGQADPEDRKSVV